ncbi:hypothetical protein [Bacillus litorisediminis]|uniref:hypothetical protein n=1 Tax=Bacillus litorisediminis TaxID=2922713 RepID=UPI001FAF1C23|nr:hypothetical protein [Bacillus litorisediminis]
MKVLTGCLSTLFCLSILGACGAGGPKDSIYEQADTFGTRLSTERPDDLNGRDLRDDRTNTNQSPTSYIDLSDDMPTLDNDVDQARGVIERETDYEPGPITINGQDMWVTAYHQGIMSEEERRKEEAALHKLLIKALPRYYIEVQLREDRR